MLWLRSNTIVKLLIIRTDQKDEFLSFYTIRKKPQLSRKFEKTLDTAHMDWYIKRIQNTNEL